MKHIKLFEDYEYLPKNIVNEIYSEYKDDIVDLILNIKINFDDIIEILCCNKQIYSYLCFIEEYNFVPILTKVRKKYYTYSHPETANSFFDIINRIYKENKKIIDLELDKKIINHFRKNKEDYIYILNNYEDLVHIFPERITDKLKFILLSKKFNL